MKIIAIGSFFIYTTIYQILSLSLRPRSRTIWEVDRQYPRFELFRALSLLLLGASVAFTLWRHDYDSYLVVRLVGLGLIATGLALSMWAQVALGKNWIGAIGIRKGHQLVTDGPYRLVRHPLYSGMWISGIGICLITLDILYGLAALVWAAAYSLRIPLEEHLLQKRFRRRFDTYAATTGALLPRIRRGGK
jgi:protein-S-isoprenylcysteine O-methyltransferase Ste14